MDTEPGSERSRWWWIALIVVVLAIAGTIVVVWLASFNSKGRTLEAMVRLDAQEFGGGLIWGRYHPLSGNVTNPALWRLPHDFVEHGTNALPELVELLKLDVTGAPSGWIDKLPAQIRKWLSFDNNRSRVGQSIAAFYALGTNAAPALPVLGRMLTNYPSSTASAHALAGIGPESIPAFITAAGSSNEWVSFCGAWGLAQFGRASRPHVAQVLRAQQTHPKAGGGGMMFWALGEIGGPPREIVPTLVTAVQSTNAWIAGPAAGALRRLNRIAELPQAHPDGWTEEERRWFVSQRPALIGWLKTAATIQGGPTPTEAGLAVSELEASDKAARTDSVGDSAEQFGIRP